MEFFRGYIFMDIKHISHENFIFYADFFLEKMNWWRKWVYSLLFSYTVQASADLSVPGLLVVSGYHLGSSKFLHKDWPFFSDD